MGDDGFEKLDMQDLIRKQRSADGRRRATEDRVPVMKQQASTRQRRRQRGSPNGPVVWGEVDGEPGWTLHGEPVTDGVVLEVYTNRANGWLTGSVIGADDGEARPRLVVTMWNPWGDRDAEGLPPRVGRAEIPLPEGAVCRWTEAMRRQLD